MGVALHEDHVYIYFPDRWAGNCAYPCPNGTVEVHDYASRWDTYFGWEDVATSQHKINFSGSTAPPFLKMVVSEV